MRRIHLPLIAALTLLTAISLTRAHGQAYTVTNLVSDGSVPAVTTDTGFQNPWGMSVSGTWWISTANTGFNYVVPSTSNTILFKVVIPSGSGHGTGTPAGSVTTAGAAGMVLSNGTKASFLFSTLDGTISGWNSKLGTAGAVTLITINNSAAGASYPGLALLNVNATTSYLLVPNFGAGNKIEVYDSNFQPAALAGSFTDPNLPTGYAPYSIHILNNQVWVAYALRGSSAPYIPTIGEGNGIVDVFDTSGNFVARAVTGGNLNAPWGVAFAPSTGFGIFSGDLLIGNFGDGKINVYNPTNYAYLGQLMDSTGKSLTYASLWELLTGGTPVSNTPGSMSGGSTSSVYFTAGLANEQHGLLADIASTTVAGATPTFGFSASTSAVSVINGSSGFTTLSIAPVNGFSGTVNLSCSGLPAGSICAFNPISVAVGSNAPATSLLALSTSPSMVLARPYRGGRNNAILALASLLPFSFFLLVRRRFPHRDLRLFGPLAIFILCVGTASFIIGCSNSNPTVPTPAGTSNVTVTAMSSTGVSQSTVVALTVQ